jgi:ATP diphosphatase
VFGEVQVEDTAEVKRNWEQIKAKERAEQVPDHDSHVSEILLLDAHLPSGLPAIQKALKIQERAAKKGFDWKGVEGAIAKCREELDELEEAIANADEKNTLEECGDVAFAVVKIARFLNVDVETALQGTNRKFVQRFEAMEKALQCDGTSVSEQELHVLTDYWNRAKRDG